MKAAFDRLSAAYYLSVPERVLTDLVDAGKIPHRKIGKKVLFIQRDLDAWLETLPGLSVKQALVHDTPAGIEPRPSSIAAEAIAPPTPIVIKRGPRGRNRASLAQ
jgi:excisionase family DNA binding protein